MKIEKLPSGSYRVRKTQDGRTYSLTFDHNPTQKEIRLALEERVKTVPKGDKLLFSEASKQYTDLKRNILSPATIREYDRTLNRLPSWFTDLEIHEIDQAKMQQLVNEMSQTLQPKTVKDRHAFCVSVIRLFIPSVEYFTTLPQKPVKTSYIPSDDDIRRIVEEAVGTQYHIPIQLACYGLRRGEICALEVSDLSEDNFLSIDKDLVQDTNKNWIVKTTKTIDSTRTIAIDDELANEIREVGEGRVFKGYPETIGTWLTRTQDKLGIERFSLHKIRHYFCSTLSREAGLSESTILALGGWKQNSDVMKRIYRHSNITSEKERMKEAAMILKKSRS